MVYNTRLYLREKLYFPLISHLIRFSLLRILWYKFPFTVAHIHTFKCLQCFPPISILLCSQALTFCIQRPYHWNESIPLGLQPTVPTLPISSIILPCEVHFVRVCGTPLCTTKLFATVSSCAQGEWLTQPVIGTSQDEEEGTRQKR